MPSLVGNYMPKLVAWAQLVSPSHGCRQFFDIAPPEYWILIIACTTTILSIIVASAIRSTSVFHPISSFSSGDEMHIPRISESVHEPPDRLHCNHLNGLYRELKDSISDCISRKSIRWVTKRQHTAFRLHDLLLELVHWRTDIRDGDHATLQALEENDPAFADEIRDVLIYTCYSVSRLRRLLETSANDDVAIDGEFETILVNNIQASVHILQQQVAPLRAFIDARLGVGVPGAIKKAAKEALKNRDTLTKNQGPSYDGGEDSTGYNNTPSRSDEEVGVASDTASGAKAKPATITPNAAAPIR
ncbi:hypothetical protein F4678DRAFT_462213 [Xylaria arbuscula]|nr:hypothetical protein F4678DRAFT_462213 [Xylaria arbuscula]